MLILPRNVNQSVKAKVIFGEHEFTNMIQ